MGRSPVIGNFQDGVAKRNPNRLGMGVLDGVRRRLTNGVCKQLGNRPAFGKHAAHGNLDARQPKRIDRCRKLIFGLNVFLVRQIGGERGNCKVQLSYSSWNHTERL